MTSYTRSIRWPILRQVHSINSINTYAKFSNIMKMRNKNSHKPTFWHTISQFNYYEDGPKWMWTSRLLINREASRTYSCRFYIYISRSPFFPSSHTSSGIRTCAYNEKYLAFYYGRKRVFSAAITRLLLTRDRLSMARNRREIMLRMWAKKLFSVWENRELIAR